MHDDTYIPHVPLYLITEVKHTKDIEQHSVENTDIKPKT